MMQNLPHNSDVYNFPKVLRWYTSVSDLHKCFQMVRKRFDMRSLKSHSVWYLPTGGCRMREHTHLVRLPNVQMRVGSYLPHCLRARYSYVPNRQKDPYVRTRDLSLNISGTHYHRVYTTLRLRRFPMRY